MLIGRKKEEEEKEEEEEEENNEEIGVCHGVGVVTTTTECININKR
jgi:hypothetical protein